jgi:hypothetical protein
VKFGHRDDAKVTDFAAAAEPAGYYALYGAAVSDFKARVAADVGREIPFIEGFVLVFAVLTWWLGRFATALVWRLCLQRHRRHYVSFRTMSGNSEAPADLIGNVGSSRAQVLPIAQHSFARIQESNWRVS